MATRREFPQSSAAAVAAARPIDGWQGANNRVRMAVIGCGNRAGRVFDAFTRSGGDGVQYVAACEVNKAKLDQWMAPARQTFKLEVIEDYRRVLDRKDVDAVLIGTPDFSHSKIMVDAIAAGKDVYCEKPASNTVARINAMLDAYKKSDRVVQIGTHQRSWDHFAEAKKIVDGGLLGTVTHVSIVQPGTYARPKEAEAAVPAGLNWDLWQMDAPKRTFKPSRLDYPLDVHTKNVLDCVKSRQKPNAHMEIGYHSALPCLLALEALSTGKPLGWDAAARQSKAL